MHSVLLEEIVKESGFLKRTLHANKVIIVQRNTHAGNCQRLKDSPYEVQEHQPS